MKLRIKDHTIRLRFSVEELDRLCEGKTLTMSTSLVNGELITIVRPRTSSAYTTVDDGELLIDIPLNQLVDLKASNEEGFKMELGTSTVLVEKDFACIGRSDELNAGLFDNPKLDDGPC